MISKEEVDVHKIFIKSGLRLQIKCQKLVLLTMIGIVIIFLIYIIHIHKFGG